jgi:3-hydroxyisobutyrate dehydrogenase
MNDKRIKVAVLGLGIMGSGMAGQLIAKGFDVTVWNRDRTKAQPLGKAGASIAAAPEEAAEGADFVVAMLAHDDASKMVWLGDEGALPGMRPGAIAIDCSTLSVGWVRILSAAAAERGVDFIDAPVTGTKPQAASGTLRFFAGGDPAVLAKAEGLFLAMGTELIRLGPVGTGAMLKLINNFLCGVQVASLAEAMVMTERSGLDVEQAIGALTAGAPGSPLVKMLAARMLARDYQPNFLPALMAKDLRYAASAFAEEGIALASADSARARFEAAAAQFPEADMATVIEPIRETRRPDR